jgi:hypothetical protein
MTLITRFYLFSLHIMGKPQKNKPQRIENQLVEVLCCGERGTIHNPIL